MIPIHAESSTPCNAVLAIAIKQIQGSGRQNHVGLIYKIAGNPTSLLHLRWHHELLSEPLDPTYYWVTCDLDDRLMLIFAEWLGTIWARNNAGQVPFSIEYSGRYFDANGTFVRSNHGEGLTCATLITAIFADYGLPLIDASTWPKTPTLRDRGWHKQILKVLEAKATPDHVEKQRKLIGRVSRFRPEQIAGAFGAFGGAPIGYERASDLGKFVDQIIAKVEKDKTP